MSLNATFETLLVRGVAHTWVILAMANTLGMKNYFLLQVSVTFYKLQRKRHSIVLLQI